MDKKDLEEFEKSMKESTKPQSDDVILELHEEINRLKRENLKLHKTLEEYGIEEYSPITDVEIICTEGIKNIKALAHVQLLTEKDAKTLDLLHKNLRSARGPMEKKQPRGKVLSAGELLRIVDDKTK